MPYCSTLHKYYWLMSIFAYRCSGKTINISGICKAHNPLKTKRRQMVALIDYHHPVISHSLLHTIAIRKRLHNSNINNTTTPILATAHAAYWRPNSLSTSTGFLYWGIALYRKKFCQYRLPFAPLGLWYVRG